MFTGIIQEIGRIISIDKSGDWIVTIRAPQTVQDLQVGGSVACNGICLTVIECNDLDFTVQISEETLNKTTTRNWHVDRQVNVERAMRMGEELGGHMVLGHVDGLAKIVSRTEENDSVRFVFKVPDDYTKFIAPKGSIALDGISLTINDVNENMFGVNIIPHTQKATTISLKQAGDNVNFEVDMIARYIGQFLANREMAC